MELPVHKFPLMKLVLHMIQLVLVVVAWILCITILRSDADVDGRVGWYFALCFLTLVPIIYLTMTPRFPRTRKFANPYAMVGVDLLFAILWLSAFAAMASWKSDSKRCRDACGRSNAVIALGVFIWLLFMLTTFMSTYATMFYRREGYLPGESRIPTNAAMIDPDKEAFSTAPGVDEYAPVHAHDEDHEERPQYDDAAHGGMSGPGNGYAQPRYDEETGYTGYGGMPSPAPGNGSIGRVQGGGRAQFPGGNYDAA